jgi:hypothetical protein
MMGRFTVSKKHAVLGTDQVVYLKSMSALSSAEFRKSVLASLVESKELDTTERKLAAAVELRPKQLANVALHTFDDEGLLIPTFASPDEVEAELSEAQLEDLSLALSDWSGFGSDESAVARRFRDDGGGEAGGAAASPDGEGIRAEAE